MEVPTLFHRNPYRPGAGQIPAFFAGRKAALDAARQAIGQTLHGSPSQSVMFYGLHGAGKTVLLRKLQDDASSFGALPLPIEINRTASLAALLVPALKGLLIHLSFRESAKTKIDSALGALRSFVDSIRNKYTDVEVSLDVPKLLGVADSGNFVLDLTQLLCRIGELARDARTAVIIFADEVLQFLSKQDLSALLTALHQAGQRSLPVIMIGAGLPSVIACAVEAKAYAERFFRFVEISALDREGALESLENPAIAQGVAYDAAAAAFIIDAARGYPFFIQTWGHFVWRVFAGSGESIITPAVAKKTALLVVASLDAEFFRLRMERPTPNEKEFLIHMAQIARPPIRTADIAKSMNCRSTALSSTLDRLIKKGVIHSPQYGELAFSVPMLDDYLRRISR